MSHKPRVAQIGRFGLQYRGIKCLNCEHPLDLSDKYCPNCSQTNSIKKLSLLDFFDEFLASIISYDSKLLKTLAVLLSKPGKITRDFIDGKRVSYTNPFRFLLSLSIIYFLMMSFSTNLSFIDKYGAGKKDSYFKSENSIPLFFDKITQKDTTENTTKDLKKVRKTLDSLHLDKAFLKRDSLMITNAQAYFKKTNKKSLFARFFKKRAFFSTLIQHDTIEDFGEISTNYDIASTKENRSAFNAAKSYLKFLHEPGSFLNSIISKLPFATFFFLPVFTLFVWMIYIRKKHSYTEHLIFSFHNQSLFFILLIISFIIDAVFDVTSGLIFIFIFSIYLFVSMRKFYKQGFFKTIIKYLILNIIFLFLGLAASLLLFVGSIFTY